MTYFTYNELTKSQTAKRLAIDNTPGAEVMANLKALVDNVLDPLRKAWGAPIIVTSGYRCTRLNQAVGGAKASQHTKGEAADIVTLNDRPEDNGRLLKLLIKLGNFDQVINEFPDDKGQPNWIHVSWKRNGNNRHSQLIAQRVNGKTTYISAN